jgi:hypothetical protein
VWISPEAHFFFNPDKRILGEDMKNIQNLVGVLFATAWLAATPCVHAASVTFSASTNDLAASATFDTSGSSLIVTLRNTSLFDVLAQNRILTAVFFDVDGPLLSLTPGTGSAVLDFGSVVHFGGTDPGGVVGGEWAYLSGISGQTQFGQNYGISSSGFGIFGGANFPGTDLSPPPALDGVNYGITSAGDNMTTGNLAVIGGRPLIQNSVVFTLPGLPLGFDPSALIKNVTWQYGTSLNSDDPNEPVIGYTPVPEPGVGSVLLMGLGMLVLGQRVVRR